MPDIRASGLSDNLPRRPLALVMSEFTLLVISSIGLVVVVTVALLSLDIIRESDLYLTWVLATWGAAAIFMQANKDISSLLNESLPKLNRNVSIRKDSISKLVDETWQPYVRQLIGKEEVCVAAAEMIRRAHKKEVDFSDRFILFQGAASLSTSSKREEEWGIFEADEDAITPYQLYSGAIDDAVSDNVRMRRVISLPTLEDLDDRSSFLVRDYLDWHSKEFYRLKRNENYVLTDTLGAPEWRSGVSAILTRRAILFMIGKGEAGVLVQDDRISEVIRIALNESLVDAERRTAYGESGPRRSENLVAFREKADRIRAMKGED